MTFSNFRMAGALGFACITLAATACQMDSTAPREREREREEKDPSSASRTSAALEAAGVHVIDDGSDTTLRERLLKNLLAAPDASDRPLSAPTKHAPVETVPKSESWRERLVQQASARQPQEVVLVSFDLSEVTFDWKRLHGVEDQEARDSILAERRNDLRPAQQGLVDHLRSIGATGIEEQWLTNTVFAVLPAASVSRAVAHSALVSASISSTAIEPGLAYSGRESKDAVRITNFYNAGLSGSTGGSTGSNITIGIIEANSLVNFPHRTHAGFPGSRLISVETCHPGPNCVASAQTMTTDHHGTEVAMVAGGSIENGEDANYSTTQSRAERSGHLKGSRLRYYHAPYDDSIYRALSRAVQQGVDIVNLSLGSYQSCDRLYNSASINQAISTAIGANVLPVISSGNSGSTYPNCSVVWPAHSRDALIVGGMATGNFPNYDSVPFDPDSSKGPLLLRSYSGAAGSSVKTSGVDLVAPDLLTLLYTTPGNSYLSTSVGGTSLAAPIVAAMAGGLKSVLTTQGAVTARDLLVNSLLLGDGWIPDGTRQATGMNDSTGAGRAKLHWPSSADFTGPFAWLWTSFYITQSGANSSKTWSLCGGPCPANLTQMKIALAMQTLNYTPLDLNAMPDVDFVIEDTCPPGGGTAVVAQDVGYDPRTKFRLSQADIAGRCLRLRLYSYAVPPSGVNVMFAYYMHSGPTTEH